jgi:hypothetical protein
VIVFVVNLVEHSMFPNKNPHSLTESQSATGVANGNLKGSTNSVNVSQIMGATVTANGGVAVGGNLNGGQITIGGPPSSYKSNAAPSK